MNMYSEDEYAKIYQLENETIAIRMYELNEGDYFTMDNYPNKIFHASSPPYLNSHNVWTINVD